MAVLYAREKNGEYFFSYLLKASSIPREVRGTKALFTTP
jgi:hypothetical protein